MGHRSSLGGGFALIVALLCTAAQATEYSVVIQGQNAGRMTVEPAADGSVAIDTSYRDNGRGPDIRETMRVDGQGRPVSYRGEGKSTFGAPIDESFTIDGGRVRWKSPADQGDEAAPEGFVFVPLEGSFAYYSTLARSLLLRPGSAAPTIRGQQLRAERVLSWQAPGASGPVPVVLVAVTGAMPTPWFFWFRDDAALSFFGVAWPGFAMVEKGHEALAQPLAERLMAASDERLAALGRRLAQPAPGVTLVRAVRWFDAPAARLRGPSDVWLFDGRIGAVTPPGALKVKADRTVDGTGRTLVPGLWDSHGHTWAGDCLMNLASGVTGVRDPANDNDFILRLRGQVERGEMKCTTIVPMGFIEGKSPYSSRNGFVVDSLEDGLAAVDWYAARGFHSLKLYNSIKPEWVKPLAARAHAQGLRVAGHVPAFMLAEQAVKDGYDEITHINQAMLNFVTRPGDDPRTLMRFDRIGTDARRVAMNGAPMQRFLRLLKQKGTWVDPTAVAFEAMFTQAQGQPNPTVASVADHLPVLWQRGIGNAEMDLAGPKLAMYRESYRRLLDLVGALHRAGVPMVAGTDSWTGIGLHRELELYVQAGIPPLEALRMATWNGAANAGAGATRGRIERGYQADLVLLEGDPSKDISAVRRASLVIRGTDVYRPDEVWQALGFKPFVPGARWAD